MVEKSCCFLSVFSSQTDTVIILLEKKKKKKKITINNLMQAYKNKNVHEGTEVGRASVFVLFCLFVCFAR